MTLETLHEFLASFWTVWAVIVFLRHRLLGPAAAQSEALRERRPDPPRRRPLKDWPCQPRSRRTHVSGQDTTGHEWDGVKELNNAAADVVGLHLLRHHRLRRRLLRPVPVLAVAQRPYPGPAGLLEPRRAAPGTPACRRRNAPASSTASAPRRWPTSARTRSSSTSPWRAAARPSRPTACSAMAPAAAAARASPTWWTTTGSGAAASTRSTRPSSTAFATPTTSPASR